MKRKQWSEADLKTLVALRAHGASWPEVGEHFGVSADAASQIAALNKLSAPRGRKVGAPTEGALWPLDMRDQSWEFAQAGIQAGVHKRIAAQELRARA